MRRVTRSLIWKFLVTLKSTSVLLRPKKELRFWLLKPVGVANAVSLKQGLSTADLPQLVGGSGDLGEDVAGVIRKPSGNAAVNNGEGQAGAVERGTTKSVRTLKSKPLKWMPREQVGLKRLNWRPTTPTNPGSRTSCASSARASSGLEHRKPARVRIFAQGPAQSSNPVYGIYMNLRSTKNHSL